MNQLVVTTSASGLSRTQIWNPHLPLALGHPLRWIAELTESGVRIRSLGSRAGEVTTGSVAEIAFDKIRSGAEIALPQSKGMSIRIRPAEAMRPVFGTSAGENLSVFTCTGNWVLSSALFQDTFTAKIDQAEVFVLRKQADTYSLEARKEGLSLRTGSDSSRILKPGEAAQIAFAKMAETSLSLGGYSWRFGFSKTVEMPELPADRIEDAESLWFKKALRYTVAAFGAFMVLTLVWPQSKEDPKELIPAQVAKIILSKPPAQTKSSASEGNPTPGKAAMPEKVQKAAVVQAFRAKALSSAVNGLLKGGMTSLLAQSDFVSGSTASANARKIFDAKSSSLQATGPSVAMSADTNKQVGTLGGSGQGKGAGYGKGEKAGLKGQGEAFVSMDVGGAAVDEGLTKDEVGEVIHRHLSEVRYCYESAMVRTPDLEGKLMVNFTIGGNGVVKSTEVKSSTLPDPRLDDCILRRLTTWKFPNPRGGIDVAVTYPFIFKTLGK